MITPIIINGKRYNSIKEMLSGEQISETLLYNTKIKYNLSTIDAVFKIKEIRARNNNHYHSNTPKEIVINGITYASIAKALKALSISDGKLRSRMKRYNLNTEKAIESILEERNIYGTNIVDRKGKATVINGKRYNSIKDAAEDCGLNYQTVISYIKLRNMSAEEVINTLLKKSENGENTMEKTKPVIINNKSYKTIREAMLKENITSSKLQEVKQQYNLDTFDAVSKIIADKIKNQKDEIRTFPYHQAKEITVNGVTYTSISKALKEVGITQNQCYYRMKRHNLSAEKAIESIIEERNTGSLESENKMKEENASTSVSITQTPIIKESASCSNDLVDMVVRCKEMAEDIAKLEKELAIKKEEYNKLKENIINRL